MPFRGSIAKTAKSLIAGAYMLIRSRLFQVAGLLLVLVTITSLNLGQRRCCAIDRHSPETACAFDRSSLSFAGAPLDQAKCLLRRVKIRAHLDPALARLPDPLEDLIGKPVTITPASLNRYISSHSISATDIGGDLDKPLSQADAMDPQKGSAKYFVIHDTSTPNYIDAFPPNINEATWSGNNLHGQNPKITHAYVNRLGQSRTVVSFDKVLPARNFGTKFSCCLDERRKGLFLHVELIQPRQCDSTNRRCTPARRGSNLAGSSSNDNLAPTPGFTTPQLDRLALLYVAASVRKGEWLIPVFHAAMDATLADAHDDPQNFELEEWAQSINRLLAELTPQSGTVIIDSAMSLAEAIGSQNVPADIRANLTLINVRYFSFDGKQHQGQVLIDKSLSGDIEQIFGELAQRKFPIAKVIPVSKYGFSDRSSMEDNNTSAFNYRVVAGTTTLSNHARGRAIDINPFLNPYIKNDVVDPPEAKYDPNVSGTIVANDSVVMAFKKRGWSWGGDWTSLKDYQHFEK